VEAGPDGVRAKGGVRLGFTNSTTVGEQAPRADAGAPAAELAGVGVDMQISNIPAAVIWGEFYVKSKFDSLMVGIQASVGATRLPEPDPLQVHPAETGSGRNRLADKKRRWTGCWRTACAKSTRERRAIYLRSRRCPRRPRLSAVLQLRADRGREGRAPQLQAQSNVLHNT